MLQNYAELVEVAYSQLLNYRWVAKQYEGSVRTELSWSHHERVASRPDRLDWLKRAAEEGWSVRQLREEAATADQQERQEARKEAPAPQPVFTQPALTQAEADIRIKLQMLLEIGQDVMNHFPEEVGAIAVRWWPGEDFSSVRPRVELLLEWLSAFLKELPDSSATQRNGRGTV